MMAAAGCFRPPLLAPAAPLFPTALSVVYPRPHPPLPGPPRLPQNSNLVLTAEQRTSAGREPDGSAESLWGRMKGQMGDRVTRERPEGLQKKPARKREGAEGEAFDLPKRRKVGAGRAGR